MLPSLFPWEYVPIGVGKAKEYYVISKLCGEH